MLPTAGGIDGRAAPDTGSTVEIEEGTAARARAVFHYEMAVEKNGFDLREQGIVAIEIGPASLRHADGGILEIGNGAAEKIGFGNEVGVKDGDKFAARGLQSIFQRAGFETF